MKIVSRKESREAGLTRYFTGDACIHGHLAERHTGNNACVVCQRASDKVRKARRYKEDENFRKRKIARGVKRRNARYHQDPLFREKVLARCKKEYESNKEVHHAASKKWAANNPERRKEILRNSAKKTYAANPEKYKEKAVAWRIEHLESARKRGRQWQKNNAGVVNFRSRSRTALKMKAMPKWADKEKIKQIYVEAKRLGLVVDHIIPLKSKYVCGLHVENNLQLLTAAENAKKHNKFNGGPYL